MLPQQPKIASINLTNAIPKRVKLICQSVDTEYNISQICWQRHNKVVASDAINVESRNLLSYFLKVWLTAFRGKFDVILFDDFRLLPVVVLLRIFSQVQLVYNRQEVPTATVAERLSSKFGLSNKTSNKIAEWLEGFLGRKVAGVITIPVGQSQTRYLRSWNRPILVLANYPELSSLVSRRAKRNSSHEIRLIYSGAIKPETGLYQYLELVSLLNNDANAPRVVLTLVGHVWDSSGIQINQIIENYNCSDFVNYRQWVPYNELQQIYDSSDIALAYADPTHIKYSLMESGSSRKVFTYMAAGLPILAGGAFSQIVAEESVGLCSGFSDSEEMHENARKLIHNSKLRAEMSVNALNAISSRYNWDQYGDATINFFKDITNNSMKYGDNKA
jgi:glycosyltransferase involved in cell wall biosynthesis